MAGKTTFTQATADTICERIALGESLRAICRDESMPNISTVLKWLCDIDGFSTQYARAREAQADSWADEILEISDDGSNDWMLMQTKRGEVELPNHEHITRSKLRVDTRKWLMARMQPKKYGERIQQTISDPDGKPVPLGLTIVVAGKPEASNE